MTIPIIGTITTSKESGSVTAHGVDLSGTESVGDVLLVLINSNITNPSTPEFATPSGWTKVGEGGTTVQDTVIAAWVREVDGAEDAAYTFTSTTAAKSVHYCIEISGVLTSDIVNASNFTGSSSSGTVHTIPEVTTDANDCLVIAAAASNGGDMFPFAVTGGAGWAETIEDRQGTTSGGVAGWVGDKDLATAGGSVACEITATVSDHMAYCQIALNGITDTTSPNLSLETAVSITPTSVVLGATTDDDTGTAHAIITANGDESAPTNQEVIDGGAAEELFQLTDVTILATGAFTFASFAGMAPATTYGYVIVHEDGAGNEDAGSRVEGTFTTSAAYAGSATYSGSPIPATSILFVTSGTMTAANDASSPDRLTDSTASFGATDNLVGMQAYNFTDSSFAEITASTGTTADGNLAGGSDNSWDNGDAYQILIMADTDDVIYFQNTATVSSESASFNYYIYDDSAGTYSAVASVTVTASGAADGVYDVAMDVLGTPTLTLQTSSSTGSGGVSSVIMRRLVKKQREKRKKKEAQEVNDHNDDVRAAIDALYGDD